MNLAELDQASADLVREYQKLGKCAMLVRTFGTENFRVICPAIDKAVLSSYLNKAADIIFDGQDVRSRNVP